MIPLSTRIVSGVALSQFDGETKMLMMKRVKGEFWYHVGGSIEGDETGVDAIIREYKEETDIDVTSLYYAQYLDKFYQPKANVIQLIPVFVVFCPPNQVVTLNEEHTEYLWCSLDEALQLVEYPEQEDIYQHIWRHFVLNEPNPRFKVDIC